MKNDDLHLSPAETELAARKVRIRRRLSHSTTVSLAFLAGLIILALVALGAAWQARRSAGEARRALRETEEQKQRAESALAESRLAQAKALRAGGAIGWRFQGLAALQEAARIRPKDAFHCVSLVPLRWASSKQNVLWKHRSGVAGFREHVL